MGVRVTMDLFEHRYYTLNRILLTLIGQWPYQTLRVRFIGLAAMFVFGSSLFVPQMLALLKGRDDWQLILECIPPLLFSAGCSLKLFYSLLNWQKMLKLLNYIRTDWQVWNSDREVIYLHEYAERGRKITIVYGDLLMLHIASHFASTVLFTTQPAIPKIIDILLKNGSKPGEFPIPLDYHHLDMQKYYFYIVMHYFLVVLLGVLVIVAYDAMFIVYVQHSCGLFTALGHKLGRIGEDEGSTETGIVAYPSKKEDIDFEHLSLCINRHNRAIKAVSQPQMLGILNLCVLLCTQHNCDRMIFLVRSAELIESTYTWCFFCIVGLNLIMISVLEVQVLSKTVNPEEAIRFISMTTLTTVHLYSESYMSQTLMDHSISIRYYILKIKWYRLSLKTQKLLLFMMMRCNEPCKLTAGKVVVMSVKTFGAIMRTSVSYFTILRTL